MENQEELVRLSSIATHLEQLQKKLYNELEPKFLPVERVILFKLISDKLNSVIDGAMPILEANGLIEKRKKGRPRGNSDKLKYKQFIIAEEYINRMEPGQSESLINELMSKNKCNRSTILRAINEGPNYNKISTHREKAIKIEKDKRYKEVSLLIESGMDVTEASEHLAEKDRQMAKVRRKMLDIIVEGNEALDALKW